MPRWTRLATSFFRNPDVVWSVAISAKTSDGVRLDVGGLDVSDEFVLLLSGDGVLRENAYKVVWRRGPEVGAKFVSVVRSGFALQDQFP